MPGALKKSHTQETMACCCIDVGTVIDNSDCKVAYNNQFASRTEAEQVLFDLTKKARQAESEPCQITSQVTSTDKEVTLAINFDFSCQAEAMIFQLSLR